MPSSPPTTPLHWAVQRLSQLQNAQLDLMQLHAGVLQLDNLATPAKQLTALCGFLGKRNPVYLKVPDRAQVPMLTHVEALGWAVVVDRAANGQWVLQTQEGTSSIDEESLKARCAVVNLGSGLNLGWGLLGSQKPQRGFMTQVRETLFLYKSALYETTLASAFIGFLALATSLFSMQVYDRVIPTRSEYTLIILALGVILSILIELGMKFARSHTMDYVVVGLDNRLSREIFDRLLQLRVDQVPNSVGSLASQMRGYEQVRAFYTSSTLFTLIDLPLALVFIVVIAVIASPWVAVVSLVFAVISILIGLSIRKKVMQYARDGASFSNLKTGLLVEAVEGIETIKAGSGGWRFLSRWIDVNARTIQSDLKSRGASESVGYFSAAIQQASYVVLVIVGAFLVMQGHMTQGGIIASSILSGRILAPILAIPGLLVQFAHAQAALEGLEKLYQLKTDHDGIEAPLTPEGVNGRYELTDVKFSYGDNPPALVIPRLCIQAHERIVVLGPIGAGKSSLLRVLSGLYEPAEGRITLDGLELGHIHRQILNQNVGYLQQDHRLFQGTLRENLLIGMTDPGDEAILVAMRRTGMDQMVASHPKGLSRVISEGGKGLSGGQKQLLAFTRLVLCQPCIYLLDEPTATMNDEQEKRCLKLLEQEASAGKSMVIVTHKSSLLPLASRVIVVASNRVVLDGPRDVVLKQLQQQNATAREQAQSQFSGVHS
jgi:ATP-binding cassette, subfamily C, bacterial LapB